MPWIRNIGYENECIPESFEYVQAYVVSCKMFCFTTVCKVPSGRYHLPTYGTYFDGDSGPFFRIVLQKPVPSR